MRVTVVHNPRAGYAPLTKAQLLDLLREAGYETDYWPVDAGSEFTFREPAEMVVVAGGDGTVRQVASALVGIDIPIAILPQGTANNIARTLGWDGTPEQMVPRWHSARSVTLDAGVAEGPWGRRCFFEAAGVGLFADAMPELSIHKKRGALDFDGAAEEIRYDLDVIRRKLRHASPAYWGLSLDGTDVSGTYLLVEALNLASFGPALRLAPEADPSDGCLDAVLIGAKARHALQRFLEGGSGDVLLHHAEVRRCRTVQIEWHGRPIHADDRAWPQIHEWDNWAANAPHPVTLTVHPAAVRILAS